MSRTSRFWIVIGAAIGALGVLCGAFGAHGLTDRLAEQGYAGDDLARRLEIFETAARYQLFTAFALLVAGVLLGLRASKAWEVAGVCLVAGALLFSGLLYVLTFAGNAWSWLGAVVPVGGVLMIAGWVLLAVGAAWGGDRRDAAQ